MSWITVTEKPSDACPEGGKCDLNTQHMMILGVKRDSGEFQHTRIHFSNSQVFKIAETPEEIRQLIEEAEVEVRIEVGPTSDFVKQLKEDMGWLTIPREDKDK